MVTDLGKALRKLRIDLGERIIDMADRLGISAAFLSAVETGRKAPPKKFLDEVIRVYGLEGNDAENLRLAAARSKRDFKLTANSSAARETADLLARRLDSLTETQLAGIRDILRQRYAKDV